MVSSWMLCDKQDCKYRNTLPHGPADENVCCMWMQASTKPEEAEAEPAKADGEAGKAGAAPDKAEDGSAVVSTLKKSKEAAAEREGGEEVRGRSSHGSCRPSAH